MLSISKPLSSGQAQTYHAIEFTSPEANYWKQGDTVQGEWQGKMAHTFGLTGAVGADEFARLTEGKHPHTEEQLVRHRAVAEYKNEDGKIINAVEHRAGWDATFSAPKSVSLTALVGGDDNVREAHRNAVTAALTELERYTQARIGGNEPAEGTGRFLAAKFEHDTARPVDGYAAPQLHTHAVVFNMTEREDGSTRAVQSQGWFDTQQFATAVYQSHLTFELRKLGYELEVGKSGAPEIKGYSPEYLAASSPRREQIEEAMRQSGFQGPEAAQIAAHATRDGKQILTPDEVMASHRVIADVHGNQADKVVAEARERALSQGENRTLPITENRAQESVTYAKEKTFEREAVRDERGILTDAMRRGMGEVTYPEIRQNFDARHAAGEFVAIDSKKHDTGRSFTSADAIQQERSVVAIMQQGQGAAQSILPIQQAIAISDSREMLNPAQRRVIEEVLTSRDQIHGLQGLAGSGKTTTLEAIREGAEKAGYAVEGFAPTSRAAQQLRDAGISADTLQAHLARGTREQAQSDPSDASSRRLYMVDESSLTSTRQMKEFLDRLGPHDRVLLIGDTRQHQGVDAGKPFEQLQDAGMKTSQLDQIMRQKDPELLKAVEHLSRNETMTGITMLQSQGRITEIPNAQDRYAAIVKDYAANPEKTLIISPDNASRRELNQSVRTELQSIGTVGKENLPLSVLIAQDLGGADRKWAEKYHVGDVLQYMRGSKELGIEKGSYTTVVAINPKENRLTVEREDGKQISYDPQRLQGVNAFRESPREFSVGDRIQFRQTNHDLKVDNGALGRIEAIDKGNSLSVKLDTGKTVNFDPAQMKHFDYGYAVTSHSSQGLTENRAIVNMDTNAPSQLLDTRFAYVSISRASQDARIYTNDAEGLGPKLSGEQSKTSAVEFKNAPEIGVDYSNTQTQQQSNGPRVSM
jgi:conjugative relaxase-like TrwC/TraI family protein